MRGRAITVAPERFEGWWTQLVERHGSLTWELTANTAVATAADGTVVNCNVPFPPLEDGCSLVDHALRERTIGVLLVRLGGYAAGVFEGIELVASKCGSRPVHGRTSAGGSSQHRFARRRENQVRVALAAAAAAAERVLLPAVGTLDAVVTGGDRRALDTVLSNPALAPLRTLISGPVLDVPDPRRSVLVKAGPMARLVHIRLVEVPE